MADLIGQQFGHYHLIRHIGEGSFADVYLGEHQHLEITAAIKVLHMDMDVGVQEAFRREARTIAHLQHPHIVRILDFGFQNQMPYLVMEYAPNGTLRTLHPKGTRLSPHQVVSYVKQIASAVDFAHGEHVIHRDIKPENLLINGRGEVVLSDFGIAVVQRTMASVTEQRFAGTPLYAAPEQIQHRPCAASDQYAVAIMAYEWLCGELPFRGPLYEVLQHHLYETPPSLCARVPELPPAVDDVLFGALAKDPTQRFPSVQEFAIILEEACFATQLISIPSPLNTVLEQRVMPPILQSPSSPSSPSPSRMVPARNGALPAPSPFPEREFVPLQTPMGEGRNAAPLSQSARPASITTVPSQFVAQQPRQVPLPLSIFLRNRKILLRRVRSFWIDGVLAHSLHGAALLALGLAIQPATVTNQWGLALQHFNTAPRMLPTGMSIQQVYEHAGGELLILGAPGSGKTTLLLELARDLLQRAEQDEQHPVPIVFNLSSWAIKQQPLHKWLVEELVNKYQMPRKFGQALVEADLILPLLDGLDEVAAKERTACIQAINTYRWEHCMPLVVCSRSTDYLMQTARVQIDDALMVQPLTPRQVLSYLASAGPRLEALCAALQRDPDLQMLSTTPLMLNILILAYQGTPLHQIAPLGSLPTKQQQIFATYVERMLQHSEVNECRYSAQQTVQRLSWLAQQLRKRNQTVFYIEHVQPDWLPSRLLRWLYSAFVVRSTDALIGLLVGILGAFLVTGYVHGVDMGVYAPLGLLLGLCTRRGDARSVPDRPRAWRWLNSIRLAPLLTGLFAAPLGGYFLEHITNVGEIEKSACLGALIGLLIGVLLNLRSSSIQPVEVVAWSWRRFVQMKHASIGLLVGLSVGLLDWAFFLHSYALLYALFCAAGGWFVSGLLSGFSNARLSDRQRVVPNQGIRHSARNGLRLGCLAGLVSGLIYALALKLIYDFIDIGMHTNQYAIPYGIASALGIGLLGWLFSGGDAAMKHRIVRGFLWLAGVMPWRLSRFLSYAEKCTLLCRVGGGYIFTHRLLLDYFARLDQTTYPRKQTIRMVEKRKD